MASFRIRISCRNPIARQRAARSVARLLFLSATWLATADAMAQQWRTVRDQDGIRTEARRIAGERFDELRVTTSLQASPETIADYMFGKYLDEKNEKISRTFVQRGPELTIWSDVVSAPMAGERCYSMRFERQVLEHGAIRVKFASLDYVGDKPKPDCIALRSRGEWVMTPTGTGTRLTYTSLTDIGGKVPALLARGSLSSAAVSSVRKVVAGASGSTPRRGTSD